MLETLRNLRDLLAPFGFDEMGVSLTLITAIATAGILAWKMIAFVCARCPAINLRTKPSEEFGFILASLADGSAKWEEIVERGNRTGEFSSGSLRIRTDGDKVTAVEAKGKSILADLTPKEVRTITHRLRVNIARVVARDAEKRRKDWLAVAKGNS